MSRREYKGAATPCTIVSTITSSSTTITISDATNWPTGSFSIVIDPGLAGEEKLLIASRTSTTLTVTTRGYDNTTASAHSTGAIIYPVPTAIDFDEANSHVNSTAGTTGIHGLTGALVGTTDTQTLTNKTISLPIIDNFILGYSTTATAAGTTTLTNASVNQQLFTGTSTQTVTMPVASTMTVGTRYLIENNSTGIVTVQSSGANTIVAIPGGMSVKVTSILNSGTTAASWDYEYVGFNAITGTGSNVMATSPTISDPVITESVNAQTGTTYTPVLTDAKQMVTLSNASAITVTIPPNSSVAYTAGSKIDFIQKGAGQVSFAQGSGVTIRSTGATATAPKLRVQYSAATCWYEGSDVWYIVGDLA